MEDATIPVRCPHGEECGACALLGMGYDEQIRRKGEELGRIMGKFPGLREIRPLPCLPSPDVARYRNRAKMAVGLSRHGGTRLGYFRGGTREIVDATDCKVLLPELLETTRRLREFIDASRSIPRSLRHIDLRCGTDPRRQHLTLVFRTEHRPSFPLEGLLKNCPGIDGVSVNLNPSSGPQVIKGPVLPLWGEREIWVEHQGHRLRVSPAAFFQVNLGMLPAIHELMQGFLDGGEVLADLYSGVGTHGLAMRRRFRRLFFAEGNRGAIADLKATVRAHGVKNVRISPVAVERGLDELREARPGAVVLNPSRAGAREAVLDALSECPVKKLAYLSCDPETLCRDLEILRTKGFEIHSVQPIDMMPQTRQVEALALLTRSQPPRTRVRHRRSRQ